MTITRVIAMAVVVAASAVISAQQVRDVPRVPATGTAQISGTISTADESRAPLRRAIVVLTGEQFAGSLSATTDDAGAFSFTSLPADRYSLSAAKAGYVPMNYGSKRPGGSGTAIVVTEGQRATVAMALVRGSVITGTVRDGLNRPLPGVTVSALRYVVSYDTGERTLESVRIGSAGQLVANYAPDAFPGTAMTDDRGEYRIYGLAAGEYIVSAAVRSWEGSFTNAVSDVHQISAMDVQRAMQLLRGSNSGAPADASSANQQRTETTRVDYVPVYYPAAIAREDAVTITLGPVEERAGVDVVVRLVTTAAVSGVITAPDGTPIVRAQVSLMDPLVTTRVFRTARSITEDGEFWIPGIPPGRYELQASAYADGLAGATQVTVEGRDVSVPLRLTPGVTVSGRIVFDGATKPPAFSAVIPLLRKRVFALTSQRFEAFPDGRFVYSAVTPGSYTLKINGPGPPGWILRSVMVNGVDGSDVPFEIKPGQDVDNVVMTLTDRPAEISGVLQNAAGEPAPGYVLIVFSADQRYWVVRTRRTKQVRPDLNGRYVARDLPAGDYLIAAVTDVEDNQWNDPAFLAALAASAPIKVTVAEGDRKVQNIRVGNGAGRNFLK